MAIAIPAGPVLDGRGRRLLTLPQTSSTVLNWVGVSLVLVVTLIVVSVPLIAPHDPLTPVGLPLQAPGKNGFLLGTDSIGRDILSRVLYGVRASWIAALVVVAVGLMIGGLGHRWVPFTAGAGAGHRRGGRPWSRIHPHTDRGVDRLVAVLCAVGAR
jgi:peptide/nickel transport system permease protein